MGSSEEVLETKECFRTNSPIHLLAGFLYRRGCALVRTVHLRRRSDLKQVTCPPPPPLTPSGIHITPSPEDLPHQYHFNLAQQLRPSLLAICNWLEEDDVQILGGWPVSAGGFTDLWRGSINTRQVAIKSYRRYLSFDLSRVFLVCLPSLASYRFHR